jgi:hypothetical protein
VRVAAVKRFRAWCLLATFVASLGSSQLSANHFGIIDTACGEVGLATGASAQVSTATNSAGQHCPVCHFLRAVSGASTASVARLAVQDGLPVAFATTTQIPPVVDPITRPSRGPPTLTPATFL